MMISNFLTKLSIAALGITLITLKTIDAAQAGTLTTIVNVPGTSDPWLAGMPDGSTASEYSNGFFGGKDIAPAQSPVEVKLPFSAGNVFTFDVSGAVNNYSPDLGNTPDGDESLIYTHYAGAENGISSIFSPINSLVGVFLGAEQPNFSPAPSTLNFSSYDSRNYLSLSPDIKQVFFIGDGRNNSGLVQEVVAPVGSTRLLLGTMDGAGWYNNFGSYSVQVTTKSTPKPVPEPTMDKVLIFLVAGWLLKKKLAHRTSPDNTSTPT